MPANANVSPTGVCQIPVMIASCSSRRSKRSRGDGKGMPYAVCSGSAQPAPSANVMRPPLMASTWATVIASGPGSRNVAALTMVPSRTRSVSRARPASVIQESVGPGSPTESNAR